MTTPYYTSMASSFTSTDQQRIIDELSSDGTLEGVDLGRLQRMLSENDTRVASLEDLAFVYTYLTGAFPSAWDVDLVDPDMVDDLEEWANLTTSSDLAGDIREFIKLMGADEGLAQKLSTQVGGRGFALVNPLDDIVKYANEYYNNKQYSANNAPKDYKGLINLAFSIGSPVLALMYIMSGFVDPVTGEKSEGLIDTISDSQEVLVDQVEEVNDSLLEIMDERESLDAAEDGPQLSNLSSKENILQQNQNMIMQNFTSLQSILSDSINALVKIAEMDNATKQRIWS